MPHIDRSTIKIERAFHDIDSAHNTSAEAAGCSEKDFEGGQGHAAEMAAPARVVKFIGYMAGCLIPYQS
jgi:hypothetical protein